MGKVLAWLLFAASSAAFIASIASHQIINDCEQMHQANCQPMPGWAEFEQACAASEAQE